MSSFNSYAKINIFLKIVGKRGNYHEIKSRFLLFEQLFDVIIFTKKKLPENKFLLECDFDCENNTIFKAYKLLHQMHPKKVDEFFSEHSLHVKKNIPIGGGLGGGSSNAATTLIAINKLANLNINFDTLCEIGGKIGADVSFFLHEQKIANVSGIGENISPFFEKNLPKIELVFPKYYCDTALVYKTFREKFYAKTDKRLCELSNMNTDEILRNYKNTDLNDLLKTVLLCYPALEIYAQEGLFLSGSGSTFFKVKK